MRVDIYATDDCEHCRRLAAMLEHTLDGRTDVECHCESASRHLTELEGLGYRTSPVVVVDGQVVGAGHDAVHELVRAGARWV